VACADRGNPAQLGARKKVSITADNGQIALVDDWQPAAVSRAAHHPRHHASAISAPANVHIPRTHREYRDNICGYTGMPPDSLSALPAKSSPHWRAPHSSSRSARAVGIPSSSMRTIRAIGRQHTEQSSIYSCVSTDRSINRSMHSPQYGQSIRIVSRNSTVAIAPISPESQSNERSDSVRRDCDTKAHHFAVPSVAGTPSGLKIPATSAPAPARLSSRPG